MDVPFDTAYFLYSLIQLLKPSSVFSANILLTNKKLIVTTGSKTPELLSDIFAKNFNPNIKLIDNLNFFGFAHTRLSIQDLSKHGNQPMESFSKRYTIVYNGEIYNHLDIRRELEEINPNIKWKSGTDTETLLEAIELWGIKKTLLKTVGMFAFVIWDT